MTDILAFKKLVQDLYGDAWVEKTATVLGVSKFAVYHWASGRRGLPPHVLILLQILRFCRDHGLEHEDTYKLLKQLEEKDVKIS